VKRLLVLAALLAVPLFARADEFKVPLIHVDGNGIRVIDTTFNHIEGDSVNVRVSTDSLSLTTTINPTRYPAWLNFQFAADANAKTAWFKFWCLDRYSINATAGTYTASNWIPVFLNGVATSGSFQVGLWDSCQVRVYGAADAIVEMSWWSEVMGD